MSRSRFEPIRFRQERTRTELVTFPRNQQLRESESSDRLTNQMEEYMEREGESYQGALHRTHIQSLSYS